MKVMHAKCNIHINEYLLRRCNYGSMHYFSLMFKCQRVWKVLKSMLCVKRNLIVYDQAVLLLLLQHFSGGCHYGNWNMMNFCVEFRRTKQRLELQSKVIQAWIYRAGNITPIYGQTNGQLLKALLSLLHIQHWFSFAFWLYNLVYFHATHPASSVEKQLHWC